MALIATHIRFALDLQGKIGAIDPKRYVAGTVYPDSRYLTGIDRALTHPAGYRDWQLQELDDFAKGWFVHLLADEIQWQVMQELLPGHFDGKLEQGNDVWLKMSAVKVLQDMADAEQIDVKSILPYFEHAENRNGEGIDDLLRCNAIFRGLYSVPAPRGFRDYYEMWVALGISAELASSLMDTAIGLSKNAAVAAAVSRIYPEMLSRALAGI